MLWEQEHIDRRVIYTDRDGTERLGTLIEILDIKPQQLNVRLDGNTRERYYVPADTVRLVPDEAVPLSTGE